MLGDFELTEIISSIIVFLALGYIIANRRYLPVGLKNIFVFAFMALTGSIISSNLEQVFFPSAFNLFEHALWAVFALLMVVGCWNLTAATTGEGTREP